jgi:hypothetical protein
MVLFLFSQVHVRRILDFSVEKKVQESLVAVRDKAFAPGGRLVDERQHDSAIGCRRPADGRLAARQARML